MKKTKKNTKNQERLEQAVYKFKFTKEQNRDLQTAFEIFDKDGTGNIDIKYLKVIFFPQIHLYLYFQLLRLKS